MLALIECPKPWLLKYNPEKENAQKNCFLISMEILSC